MPRGEAEVDIRTTPHKTTKKAWAGGGMVVVGLTVAGWWLVRPAPGNR
jgi:hypothetical protein